MRTFFSCLSLFLSLSSYKEKNMYERHLPTSLLSIYPNTLQIFYQKRILLCFVYIGRIEEYTQQKAIPMTARHFIKQNFPSDPSTSSLNMHSTPTKVLARICMGHRSLPI